MTPVLPELCMSDRSARFHRMRHVTQRCPECVALVMDNIDFCPKHTEAWARTEGLLVALAAQPIRRKDGTFASAGVEVEVEEGQFSQIETMAIDSDRIIITTTDSKRIERTLLEGAPAWRRL